MEWYEVIAALASWQFYVFQGDVIFKMLQLLFTLSIIGVFMTFNSWDFLQTICGKRAIFSLILILRLQLCTI